MATSTRSKTTKQTKTTKTSKNNVVLEEAKKETKKEVKTFKEDEGILCRSITRGELIYIGKKSNTKYIFSNHDDTCEIEVRDLNSLKASKSAYLYNPLFVIEDEEFLSQPKWKDIKEMYDRTVANDINEIIDKPIGQFKQIVSRLNKGYKDALASEVATRIHENNFDSLSKIKAIDEICGTDLYCLIS